ncbi:DMT family transporter [Affinibrenneria salicis]|uniref:DMT family transporter n=1 Tax=Affinibrenneria salicis TaxID=2590031 RepID=A0A5J5FYU2_9GAMM|nr:DMT family transporter [Affinibrenneria salicis]KAA8999351.1 DMT family transporter [Affinibrenneria salicis]
MSKEQSGKTMAVIYLLITVFAWGIMYPSSKHAVSSGIDGYYLTLIRYGLGTILVSLILLTVEGKGSYRLEGHGFKLWLFGTIGFAGLNFLTFIGVTFSSAEHATIILALMPMLSILISSLVEKMKPDLKTIICSIFAFIGIVIVITKGDFHSLSASASFIGDLLLLAATICWVIYTYFAKTLNHWSALRVTALSSALGTMSIIVITVLATLFHFAHPPAMAVLHNTWLDIFILVATTAVIITWNAGIKGLGAVNGILFVNLVPVVTFIVGIYQGHAISHIEIVGALITIVALVVNNILGRRKTEIDLTRAVKEE